MTKHSKATEWQTDSGLSKIESLASKGATFAEMSAALGVSESTFRLWRGRYSAISAAISRGHMKRAENVEIALRDLACGYCTEETEETVTREVLKDGDWMPVERRVRTVIRKLPPNASAAIFAAKNICGFTDSGQYEEMPNNDIDPLTRALELLASEVDTVIGEPIIKREPRED